MTLRTILQAPDAQLLERAGEVAIRFRKGEWGEEVRKNHHNAVFLHPPGSHPWPYRIDVWGDPHGRVTVHAHRAPEGGSA